MERIRRWLTEVNGSLGGEKVIFIGIISEWISDDGLGRRHTFNMSVRYKKRTVESFPADLRGAKVENTHPHSSLNAAKREFKSVVNRFGVFEERISWKEESK